MAALAVAAALGATLRERTLPASPPERRSPPDKVVFHHIRRLAAEYDATRRRRLESVRTPDDWARLAPVLREGFRRSFGQFPPRTPLNARIVGTLKRSGYRIEKLVFESRPGLFVTANVYVPQPTVAEEPPRRLPAVVSPVGHWEAGKAEAVVQAQCVSLARKGFVVLTWDPPGQGERSQYWDRNQGRNLVTGSTTQHTRLGNQCALSGIPLANYFVWEAVRALDYLSTRPDVDPDRLGCTGASGGGTQTLYLAALDERVKAAVPSIFVSSQRRWLLTGRIADSEQVSFGWLKDGLEQPEWCALVAPRPLLINATVGDFFPVTGTRETFAEARHVYRILGASDAIKLRVSAGGHDYAQPLREGVYEWFLDWMGGSATSAAETPSTPEEPSALWCTRSGQVDSLGGKTVFEFNGARVAELAAVYPETLRRWRDQPSEARRDILGTLAVDAPMSATSVEVGASEDRGDHTLTRLVYRTEPHVYLPASHFAPTLATSARSPGIVLVGGDKVMGDSEEMARRLATRGMHVLVVQPRGTGDTRWQMSKGLGSYHALLGSEANLTHDAWLLGTNLIGWRVRDVLAGLACLRGRAGVDPSRVFLVGLEPAGATPVLFAAALDDKVARTALVRPLSGYRSMADTKLSAMPSSLIPWGVLQRFDLPQVVALAARRPLLLANVVTASGEPATADELAPLREDAIVGARPEVIQGVEEPFKLVADWLGTQAAPR